LAASWARSFFWVFSQPARVPSAINAGDAAPLHPAVRLPLFLLPMSRTTMTDTNKVFRLVREESILVVVPQGDSVNFRYNDVHLEANRALRVLDEASIQNLVIDFGHSDYASSVVIGALIRMARQATNHGGKAVICHVNDNMRAILTTMNLFKLWPLYASREEAIAALTE
jgi:anti-anti-sigma factor